LLEEQKQCSPSHPVEGNPQLVAQALGLKEIQKDLYSSSWPEQMPNYLDVAGLG